MAAKYNVTSEEHYQISVQVAEIQRQLRQKGGSPISPRSVSLALQEIVEGRFTPRGRHLSSLRLLSKEPIILGETTGKENIYETKGI